MKKILLTVLCLMFTTLCANAGTMYVQYNNAGAPITVSQGWHAPVSMSRAETMYSRNYRGYNGYRRTSCCNNRLATPARLATVSRQAIPYGYVNTPIGMQKNPSIINYNNPTTNIVRSTHTVSRFDKNYTIKPRRSYVANGVTYYN